MDAPSLREQPSQETFISLLQLDPAPMESPTAPSADKELPPLPEEASASSSSSSIPAPAAGSDAAPLGLNKSPLFYLTRIQKYSTYTITAFASLHFATTSLIPLLNNSVAASESPLLLAREIYQTPTTEPLLVGLPVVAHVASGLAIRFIRRSQNLKRYGSTATPGLWAQHAKKMSESGTIYIYRIWPHVSYISISGYAFSVFFGAHVIMNRLLPILVEGNSSSTGLAFVAHGFAKHGVLPWIAYSGLLVVGCGHMVWGWSKWLGIAPSMSSTKTTVVDKPTRKRRRRIWWGIHAASLASAGLWAAGGLGIVARGGISEGWIGRLYDDMYAKVGM
ncbi:putative dimethylguanosine trna methyltransferase protein [Zalerion maritima]|uniref:Dimethylguanosine trna methyltransferase protein n=1 Tax=Zalerion maritima TaxID=339359 RepID=A0AAD5RG08_9PEZI|nr:putative dimethylguanosine trna methyltransferase protein [Zalerion maritima]